VAQGILTTRGGMTSHAAVVARGMGKPCVSGAGAIRVDYEAEKMIAGGVEFKKGDVITIDGAAGQVLHGAIAMQEPELSGEFVDLMKWADEVRRMAVRTNAETPQDARVARQFGAEGIGLCRTEHMFFEGDRIVAVREMILADDEEGRRKALAKLLPMQRGDFAELFEIMSGLPVTIRLLDPPLHEFLPQTEAEIEEVAASMGVDAQKLRRRAAELHEFNPMLGFRGCRLGLVYPEISEMQARAVFEAAATVQKQGIKVKTEVMIPLVGFKRELDLQVELVHRVAKEVMKEKNVKLSYLVGTMIEVPRGALTADEIAESAQFFSFGTNDLTQTCLGMSRDDSGSFLPPYQELEIVRKNPFASIDQSGVGQLMKIAVEKGRSTRPDIKLGICGEHGGDPDSVKFCHRLGLTYVSCSPFRVPVARLAAAQAALEEAAQAKPLNIKARSNGAPKRGGLGKPRMKL
jgi:pyruvate,orthophosphate dikinase